MPSDFYEMVIGRPLPERDLDQFYYNVGVEDVEMSVEIARSYPGAKIHCEAVEFLKNEHIAVVEAPDGTLLILRPVAEMDILMRRIKEVIKTAAKERRDGDKPEE